MGNEKIITALKEELAKLCAERDALIKERDRLTEKNIEFFSGIVVPMERGIGELTEAERDEVYERWDELVARLDGVKDEIDCLDIHIADLRRFSRWYTLELTGE